MGYIQDNEVFRSRPRDSTSSEDKDEETEGDHEEAPPEDEGRQEVPHETGDLNEEPHIEPMDTASVDRGRGANFSVEFERRMDQRMDHVESQLQSMQTDLHHLTQDITQFNLNFERMRFQVDHQYKFLEDIWTVFHQQPPPPPMYYLSN